MSKTETTKKEMTPEERKEIEDNIFFIKEKIATCEKYIRDISIQKKQMDNSIAAWQLQIENYERVLEQLKADL